MNAQKATIDSCAAGFRSQVSPLADRLVALSFMLESDPTRAKQELLFVAGDDSEADEVLKVVGGVLGRLCWAGLITEFDMRDMSDIAAEAVFAWEPGGDIRTRL